MSSQHEPATPVPARSVEPLDAVGLVTATVAVALVVARVIPLDAVHQVWVRVWPVLAFLLLIKAASDLVEASGLFDVAARALARGARGRAWVLLVLFCLLCVACTTVLSLDATAVLLTPLAVLLAAEADLAPEPFVMAVLWLANVASLLLPVSNLTNLLAQERTGVSALQFLGATWQVQLALVAVTVLVLFALHRRSLAGAGDPHVQTDDGHDVHRQAARRVHGPLPAPAPVSSATGSRDPALVAGTVVALLAFAAAVVTGVSAWVAALTFDAVMLVLLRWRTRGRDRTPTVARLARTAPWGMAVFALSLFVVMDAAGRAVSGTISTVLGSGEGPVGLLRLELVGAGAANLVNNLPAYLALEPSVPAGPATMALLVAVNAGPIILPWGSLATLLWLGACRQRGVRPSLVRVGLQGLVLVPLLLVTAALMLG